MAQESNAKIYGVLAVLVLALGLGWWALRDETDPETDARAEGSASADPSAPGAGLPDAKTLRRRSDIDPLTAPRAAVTGTVHDEAGQPIAGAQVCADLEDPELVLPTRLPPSCTTTREDGTYRVAELFGAQHALYASARGYLPAIYRTQRGIQQMETTRLDLRAGVTREGVDFVLEKGGVEVTGVIKDIAGGVIEDAWVSVGESWRSDKGSTFTQSDEEGRFSLWVEGPSVRVRAHAEGYGAGSREAAVPGTFVEVFLTPESVVVGTVVWADSGKPVEGAKVTASAGMWGGGSSTLSGADGSFRLEGLEPGDYKVSVEDDLLTGLAEHKAPVGLGQSSDPVIVKVHPAFSVRGTVWVGEDQPCSYGTVGLKAKERKQMFPSRSRGQEDGSVKHGGLLPGTYEVTVECDGYVSEPEYPDLVITDASLEDLSWSVRPGQAMRGIVVDAKGEPVAGARVSARAKASKDPRAQRSNVWGERTEPDGSFAIKGLLPATYELSVYHDDYASPELPIEAELPAGEDVDGLRIELPAQGRVEGVVRDDAGQVVSNVSVRLRGSSWGGSARTNDEGQFVLEAVRTGEYRITAQRGWSETMRAPGATDDDDAGERIDVLAEETTTIDLLVESQGGRITGRVLGEGGEPIADAFVEAVRESDSAAASDGGSRQRARWSSWSKQPVLTDEEGRFELTALSEGATYAVYANRKGGGEAIAEHVAEGSDVELSIAPVGVLAGVVRMAGGGFPERFTVSASDRSAGQWQRDDFLRTEGRWELVNLSPGTYEVKVDAAEGNAKTEVELTEGEERTDVELELTPLVTVTGRLVDAETGKGVPGMKVSVSAGGAVFSFAMDGKANEKDISDPEGNFVVEDAPTGKVSLIAMAPGFTDSDYGWTWVSRRLPVEPRTQNLGTIELVARRVKPGEEDGDLGFKVKEQEPDTEPEDVRQVVAFVRPGGPAATAGLKVGDAIVAIDGQPVTGQDAYRYRTLSAVVAGTTVSLKVEGDEDRTVTVVAGPPR